MSDAETIELGDKVKCKITGFEGIAVGRTKWIHGCDRISVAPVVLDKDGKPQQSQGFDEAQLTIVEKQVYQGDDAKRAKAPEAAPPKPGGPRDEPSRREDVTR